MISVQSEVCSLYRRGRLFDASAYQPLASLARMGKKID